MATREKSQRPSWNSDDWAFMGAAGFISLIGLVIVTVIGMLIYEAWTKEPTFTLIGLGYVAAAIVIALVVKLKREGRA